MPKRKTLASGPEPGQERQKREKEKHIANSLGAMEEKNPSNKETEMDKEQHVISSNNNLEDTMENDLDVSVQTSNIIMIVDTDSVRKNNSEESFNVIPNPLVSKEEGLSNSADADIVKQSDISVVIDLNSNDVIRTSSKQYMMYRKRVKNKSSDTNSVARPSLPVDLDCSANSSSLSGIAEMGTLRKTSDGTPLGDDLMLSVEKGNSALIGGACAGSDKSGMLPEINPNPDIVNVNLNQHKESENKEKDFDFSQYNLELDRKVSSSVRSSLSETVKLNFAGGTNVYAPVINNLLPNIDTEDSGMKKSADDTSPNENIISFEMASSSYQVEDPSQVKMAVGKETDKTLNCSSCSNEHVLEEVLQVNKCRAADNSDKASASEKVQRLRNKKEKRTMHEDNVSNEENEGLLDGFRKVPQAPGISEEGNLKVFSVDCKEPPSPIRGIMHESSTVDNFNKKNARWESFKEEVVSFSFQIADKIIMDESSDKACASGSGVGSENISPTIQKAQREETGGHEEREVTALSMSNIAENVVTSDAIDIQDKKLEVVPMSPERTLVSHIKKKLLVLDLNGLLADIIIDFRNDHKALKKVGGKSIFKRPFCDDFLKFCFERFDIGIWSSRKGYNVDNVVSFLMGDSKHRLLFCWDQSKCTFTGFKTLENVHKPLVLKELKKLWNKEETDLPWEKGEYSPSNTLLVDDSPYKALCNPPHTAVFPYPYHFDDENDNSLGDFSRFCAFYYVLFGYTESLSFVILQVGPGGDLRIYLEGLAVADNVQHYLQEHQFGQHAITATDPSWNFYLQVIDKVEKSSVPTQ